MGGEEGKVFADELVLQGLRSRRNHRPPTREDRGDQVGERLAGTRARLHDEVPTASECRFHCCRHPALARPGLAAVGKGGDHGVEGADGIHDDHPARGVRQ